MRKAKEIGTTTRPAECEEKAHHKEAETIKELLKRKKHRERKREGGEVERPNDSRAWPCPVATTSR